MRQGLHIVPKTWETPMKRDWLETTISSRDFSIRTIRRIHSIPRLLNTRLLGLKIKFYSLSSEIFKTVEVGKVYEFSFSVNTENGVTFIEDAEESAF